MARILVVEDEIELAKGLADNLEFEGDEVLLAHDGEQGLQMIFDKRPDLVILDVMLPKKSGFDICRELRAQGNRIAILMLTARGEELDKVRGLELGADDYLTKPFSLRELIARVKALLRRCVAAEAGVVSPEQITMGQLTVDFVHYRAMGATGLEIKLTHREFEILRCFHQHQAETITRDLLLEQVWGYEIYPTTRTVDNFIVRLRKRVEIDPEQPRHILTVHGIGYKYVS